AARGRRAGRADQPRPARPLEFQPPPGVPGETRLRLLAERPAVRRLRLPGADRRAAARRPDRPHAQPGAGAAAGGQPRGGPGRAAGADGAVGLLGAGDRARDRGAVLTSAIHPDEYASSAAATPAPGVTFAPWARRHCSSAASTSSTQFGRLL